MAIQDKISRVVTKVATNKNVTLDSQELAILVPTLIQMSLDKGTNHIKQLSKMYDTKKRKELATKFLDSIQQKDRKALKMFDSMIMDLIVENFKISFQEELQEVTNQADSLYEEELSD